MKKTNLPKDYEGLILETSAHIFRLLGSSEMRRGIVETVQMFSSVGLSRFAQQEFEAVIGGLYESVAEAIGQVNNQDRPRSFVELWREAAETVRVPYFFPGGEKLLSSLIGELGANYGERLVTPVEARNRLEGQRQFLLESIYYFNGNDLRKENKVFDTSSCCRWPRQMDFACQHNPQEHCRLQELCINRRDEFLSSVWTLANANRSESKFLKKEYTRLVKLQGAGFLKRVGERPNSFGDLVIFWEIPNRWAILTRDKTFAILQQKHRKDIGVYFVRLPRARCKKKIVASLSADESIRVTCLNYTTIDARITSDRLLGKKGQKITMIIDKDVPHQLWTIVTIDEKSGSNPRFYYGLRAVRTKLK